MHFDSGPELVAFGFGAGLALYGLIKLLAGAIARFKRENLP